MFYLTSKFHDNRVNTFGFMEGGGVETPPPPRSRKSPGEIGLKWKVQEEDLCTCILSYVFDDKGLSFIYKLSVSHCDQARSYL